MEIYIYHDNFNQKKARVVILISDKVHIEKNIKNITRDYKGQLTIKG